MKLLFNYLLTGWCGYRRYKPIN